MDFDNGVTEVDCPAMGIIRVQHNSANPYTMIRQDVAENSKLSWEARGMLAYLVGKPDNWVVRFTDLVRQSPAGEGKTRRILKELKDAGHVVQRRTADASGHFIWITTVYEVAQPKPNAAPDSTIHGKPMCGKPTDGQPTNGKLADIPSIDLPTTDSPISTRPSGRVEAAEPPPRTPLRQRTPRKPAEPKPIDERRHHPAILAIQDVKQTKALPPKVLWDKIIRLLGDQPDIGTMRRCFEAWTEAGNRPTSWVWLAEWYAQGGPPTRASPHGSGKVDPQLEILRQLAERNKTNGRAP